MICVNEWDRLIADLRSFAPVPAEPGPDKGQGHPGSPIGDAVELAETLRDLGAPPANRVSDAVAGLIHFEWISMRAMLVIVVRADGSMGVDSLSCRGEFRSEAFRWRSESIGVPSIEN